MGDILWEMSRGVLALASLYCLVTVSPLLVLEQGTRFFAYARMGAPASAGARRGR